MLPLDLIVKLYCLVRGFYFTEVVFFCYFHYPYYTTPRYPLASLLYPLFYIFPQKKDFSTVLWKSLVCVVVHNAIYSVSWLVARNAPDQGRRCDKEFYRYRHDYRLCSQLWRVRRISHLPHQISRRFCSALLANTQLPKAETHH